MTGTEKAAPGVVGRSGWRVVADEPDMLYLEKVVHDGYLIRSVALDAQGRVDVWVSEAEGASE